LTADFPYTDLSYSIYVCDVVSTWQWSMVEAAQQDSLLNFCYGPDRDDSYEHSHRCDFRTAMSGTSFATPIAAALVA
jgi:subtilisin family serine protease